MLMWSDMGPKGVLYREVDLRAAQYLDPLSAQLVHSSLTHLMAGLGMFNGDVRFVLIGNSA